MHERKPNRLIHSTSPYLLQHAHNPVDWFEWGEEALLKAKQENKPILVSIGYSSCHWCHVMEKEVFEKESMAEIMNKYLVCIKVDREERPDIDQIYMDAIQAMGQHGGWPLNVFITPDQKPFYGGTYFPPDSWKQLLNGIHKAFTERRNEVDESAEQLARHLADQDTTRFKKEAEQKEFKEQLEIIYKKLEAGFDTAWGGLDKAPKFVMPSIWLWMLRYHHLTKNEKAINQVLLTLRRIAMGGIYDQLGGGFARYSVDGYWFAPHFEKMLYDNGQLMSLYAEAYALTKDESFKTILEETFEWLQAEMMHPEGGFYSALDADSEGVEGKFYIWKKEEIESVLGKDAEPIIKYYSVKAEGNWEHGSNILFRSIPEDKFLQQYQLTADQWQTQLRKVKDQLLAVRDKRIPPGLDDKIIASWNAIMVCGLADAYKATRDERYLKAALKNMAFVERELTEGQEIFRSFKNKRSQTHGFLDDYAYVIQACIKLFQVTFEIYWLKRAEAFMIHTIDHFLDSSDGFFYYSSKYGEKLIASKKELFDNVIPSSNAVTAQNLHQLGIFLDHEEWKQMARNMTNSLSYLITNEPNYMTYWGMVHAEIQHGLAEIAVVGKEAETLRDEIYKSYQPFTLVMGTTTSNELPLLQGKTALNGKTTIYVCYDKACQKPVHEVKQALEQIR